MTKIGIIGFAGSGEPVRLLNPGIDAYSFDFTKPLELTFYRKDGKVVPSWGIKGYFYPLGEVLSQVDGPIFVSVPERRLADVFDQLDEAIPFDPYALHPRPPIIAIQDTIPHQRLTWLRKSHPNIEIYSLNNFSDKIIVDGEWMGATIFQRAAEVVALEESFGSRELL